MDCASRGGVILGVGASLSFARCKKSTSTIHKFLFSFGIVSGAGKPASKRVLLKQTTRC